LTAALSALGNGFSAVANKDVNEQSINIGVSFGDPNTVSASFAGSTTLKGTPSSNAVGFGVADYFQIFPWHDVPFR
jgi:hypothetical protein